MGWLAWLADTRSGLGLLVAAAIALRVALAIAGGLQPLESELQHVAVTLAERGEIADAYREGSGPTTHTGPLAPATAALAYWLLGSATPAAELVLTIIAAAVIATTALIWNAVFRRLGVPDWARALALLFILLLPIQVQLEVRDLRAREAGLAALMLSFVVLSAVRLDQADRIGWRPVILLSIFIAVLFVLSPAAALGSYGVCGVLALRRVHPRRWLGLAAISASALVLISAPWAYRNHQVFGETVWSRGNFGLEFAIGTNAESLSPPDPRRAYLDTLKRIHPFLGEAGYADMVASGGELPYARKLQAQTTAWIADHPRETAQLWARHVFEYYVPPAWLWNPYGEVTPSALVRTWAIDLISIMGLLALLARLLQRRWLYLYLLAPSILVAVPYIALQPRLRYRYVIASLFVFLACDLVSRALERRRSKEDERITAESTA